MNTPQSFECHVTIEPAFDRLDQLEMLARQYGFKVAKLVMASEELSRRDMFMTGHSDDSFILSSRCIRFCDALKERGFKLQRYKIEQVLLDSRYQPDPWNLLA